MVAVKICINPGQKQSTPSIQPTQLMKMEMHKEF